jgi:hypothetical protein
VDRLCGQGKLLPAQPLNHSAASMSKEDPMTSIARGIDGPASVTAVTSRRLPDGRELMYFDDGVQSRRRSLGDRRDLPGRGPSGEIRYGALAGEQVAVAAQRQNRTHLLPADECSMCQHRSQERGDPRARL